MSWSGGASLHSPVFDYGGVLNPGHITICLCTVRGFILTPRVVALFVTVNRCVGRLAPLFVLNSIVHGSREPIAVLFTAGFNTAAGSGTDQVVPLVGSYQSQLKSRACA